MVQAWVEKMHRSSKVWNAFKNIKSATPVQLTRIEISSLTQMVEGSSKVLQ